MVAGVLAIAALSYLVVHRPLPSTPGTPSAAGSSTATSSTTTTSRSTTTAAKTTEPAEASRVLVVGDGFTAASGEAGWPQLVAADLEAGGRSVTVDVAAADGSGYAEPGPQGVTFAQLAADAGAGYDVVVLVGSVSDTAFAADVQAAAEAALRAVATASPDAAILVVGPSWSTPDPPGYILTNRDTVSAAAAAAGVPFTDPIAEGWFGTDDGTLLGPDGKHPTEAGQRVLADRIGPLVDQALANRA
jgi:lysophospholipase L1-like esterase